MVGPSFANRALTCPKSSPKIGGQDDQGDAMPRFCTQCGAQNKEEAKFCRQCGAPLTATDQPPKPPPASEGPADFAQDAAAQDAEGEAQRQAQLEAQMRRAEELRQSEAEQARKLAEQEAAAREAAAAAQRLQAQQAREAHETARRTAEQAQRDQERERERLAATARLEEEIRARAQMAQSPPARHVPHADGAAVSAHAEPEPRGQTSRTQPVKGSNAFLVGGVATGVIALLLIGGGGLWWSMHKPKPESAALPAMASGAGQAASALGPVVSASAPSAPGAPTTPQTVPAAPQVVSAPVPPVSKPAPLVRKPMPVPAAKPTQPAALERSSQPETFAPAAPPTHGAAPQRQTQPLVQSPAPAREEAPSSAPPQAPPKPMGRVEALRAGLAACQEKGNFFSQQLCIQETRWKYCGAPLSPDPLWGKIPECPNSGQQNNP